MRNSELKNMNAEELSKGSVYVLVNSYDLFQDAVVLSFFCRYSRAYTLVQLAIEEAGKSIMLNELSWFKGSGYSGGKLRGVTFEEMLNEVANTILKHPDKTEKSLEFMISMTKNKFLDGKR